MDTVDYGTRPAKPTRVRMSDSTRLEMTTNITIGVVLVILAALIVFPFAFYVATVVPAQQQRMHDLRIECLAHHTVKACMDLTDGRVPE